MTVRVVALKGGQQASESHTFSKELILRGHAMDWATEWGRANGCQEILVHIPKWTGHPAQILTVTLR